MINQIRDPNCRDVNARISYGKHPEDLSILKKILDDNTILSSIEEEKSTVDNEKYYDLKVSWCKSDISDKIKDLIEGCTVSHDSPEAREIIAKGDHVQEVWEDGELTTTKGGELYGKRSLHRIGYPSKIHIIETIGENENDHQSRIVKPECNQLIKDYTDLLFYVGEINNRVKSLMKK